MNEWQVCNPSHGKVGGYPSAYQKEILCTVIKIDYNKKMASFLILLVGFVICWKDRGELSNSCSLAQYLCMHKVLALN